MTKRFGAALLLTTVLGFTALPALAWRINNAPSADLNPSPVNSNGPVTITNLTANGNVTATGTLAASGNTTLGANLAVAGNETIGGSLGVTGATTLAGLSVTAGETVGGTLTANGALAVSGNTTLGANLALAGNETIGGTLGVTGASTLASLGVTGAETVGGSLGVTGASTLASLSVTGAATVGGTLTGNGNANIAGNGNFVGINLSGGPNGEIRFSGTHVFEGDGASVYQRPMATNGTWYVFSGTPDSQRFSIDRLGNGVFSGPFSLSSTLAVSGATTLANTTLGASNTLSWSGRSQLSSVADGISLWSNNAGTGFTGLKFGAATSSFPYLKVSGASFAVRLADDSADANISAANGTFSGTLGVTGASTLASLGVTGASTLASASVTNAASVGGVLTATGGIVANANIKLGAGAALTNASGNVVISLGTGGATVGTQNGNNVIIDPNAQIQTTNGSATYPPYSFANNKTTGIYYDAANSGLAISVGGQQYVRYASSGIVMAPGGGTGFRLLNLGTNALYVQTGDASAYAAISANSFNTAARTSTPTSTGFQNNSAGSGLYGGASSVGLAVSAASAMEADTNGRWSQLKRQVATKTGATYNVLASDSYTAFDNTGATALVTFNLPAAVAGLQYTFDNVTTFGIKLQANGSDVIKFPGSASSAGGGQSTTTDGGSVSVHVPLGGGVWLTDGAPGGTWVGN